MSRAKSPSSDPGWRRNRLIKTLRELRSGLNEVNEGDLPYCREALEELRHVENRILVLQGDYHRRSSNPEEALVAYQAVRGQSVPALYGLAETYKSLGMTEDFVNCVRAFIVLPALNLKLLSRLALGAAELGLQELTQDCLSLLEAPEFIDDGRHAYRIAKSLVLLGSRDGAGPYRERALSLARDDDLILELEALDYNLDSYWDRRYRSYQGSRTPVPVADQSDQGYNARTNRDIEFLSRLFEALPARSFERGADFGCGSGRLTRYLSELVEFLDSFDVSETAIGFASSSAKETKSFFFVQNLAKTPPPANHYDLAIDFAAVQHFSKASDWSAALRGYAQALRAKGWLILIENSGNDKPTSDFHMSPASPESYIGELTQQGLSLLHRDQTAWGDTCLVFEKP